MRIPIFVISVFFSLVSRAQTDFAEQFKIIYQDGANGFIKFRGLITDTSKFEGEDRRTAFVSKVILPGTKENYITVSETSIKKKDTTGYLNSSYSALLADSVKTKKGEKLCDEWRDKLHSMLGSGFNIRKLKLKPWNPAKYGWVLSDGMVDVSVDILPAKNLNLNRVWVTISYSTFRTK